MLARFVGDGGRVIALDRFGASAPSEILYEKLGITAERVAQAARELAASAHASR